MRNEKLENRYRQKLEMCVKSYENRLDKTSVKHGVEWKDFDFTPDLLIKTLGDEFKEVDCTLDEPLFSEIYEAFQDKVPARERILFTDFCMARKLLSMILQNEHGPSQAVLFGMAHQRLIEKIDRAENPQLTDGQKLATKNRKKKMESRIVSIFDKIIRHEFGHRARLKNQDLFRDIADSHKFEHLQAQILRDVPLKMIHSKCDGALVFFPFSTDHEFSRKYRIIEKQISDIKVEMFGSQKSRKR